MNYLDNTLPHPLTRDKLAASLWIKQPDHYYVMENIQSLVSRTQIQDGQIIGNEDYF